MDGDGRIAYMYMREDWLKNFSIQKHLYRALLILDVIIVHITTMTSYECIQVTCINRTLWIELMYILSYNTTY